MLYGVTLYTFKPDSFDTNKYTKADFSNNATWPIYDTTKIVVPSLWTSRCLQVLMFMEESS